MSLTDWVVSTEDKEVKNIALSYGASVVDRPESLAGDDITSGAVLRHALDTLEDRGPLYDMVVCLHPTSPIRDPRHIDQAIKQLDESDDNYLASAMALPKKAQHKFFNGNFACEFQPDYWLNASIYAIKTDRFRSDNKITSDWAAVQILEMDRRHSIDIDTEDDWKIAELMLNDHYSRL